MTRFNSIFRSARQVMVGIAAAVVLTGCGTVPTDMYRWGVYEDLVDQGYKSPGSVDVVSGAQRLAEDMARTDAEGAEVPPGVRVHLGYLYYSQGRIAEAKALFEAERQVFPESNVFVSRLLASMERR